MCNNTGDAIAYPDFEVLRDRPANSQDPARSFLGFREQITWILLSISSRNADQNMSAKSKNLIEHFARVIANLYPDNDSRMNRIDAAKEFLTGDLTDPLVAANLVSSQPDMLGSF